MAANSHALLKYKISWKVDMVAVWVDESCDYYSLLKWI